MRIKLMRVEEKKGGVAHKELQRMVNDYTSTKTTVAREKMLGRI